MYTSDGSSGIAFLSLRSIQAFLDFDGQTAFADQKLRFFPAFRPQNLPVLRCRKRLVLPRHKPPSPPLTVQGVTHYTLQAKSCAKGGPAPFGYPRHETVRFHWMLPHREKTA